jgi:putative hydrolase of the HAD superfamily
VIRAVTFDCWGTLINDNDFAAATAARVKAVADAAGIDESKARDILNRAWDTHHAAWVRGEQFGSTRIAEFCCSELSLTGDDDAQRLCTAFEEAGRLGGVGPLDGAVDVLRSLRNAGLATALVCDTGLTPGRIVRDFLSAAGLLGYLDFCAFSNEVGVPKPHPRMFLHALDAIGARPAHSVHVGDLLRTDVAGARAVGMKTIRITAVNDDAVTGFSWDPRATFASAGEGQATATDADAVVASHAELIVALRRMGAPLD